MLFTEFTFWLFLPIVLILYWIAGSSRRVLQNSLMLLASYIFYSCWDWRFSFLLFFSTLLDYSSGRIIENSSGKTKRKIWLWLSIGINLIFLGFFKYYNFFVGSFAELLRHSGMESHPQFLSVVLPVGISFYTFHGLSYVIDIYYERQKAEQNLIDYALFVSYFPLLVAGPIERSSHLLPQLKKIRIFNYQNSVSGLRQILWGLVKKIIIADQCGGVSDYIFQHYSNSSGLTLLMGAIMFSFQIYGDFSGYSDIALGTSRLFGIELLRNFNYPYFSRDMAEFWRRWHISLSSWFRDYVYIPLGGSKGSTWLRIRNTLIIFLLSGFWHGANWTFLFWGFLNALLILPSIVFRTNRQNLNIAAEGRLLPSLSELFSITTTFLATTLCWVFFRSPNIGYALSYLKRMASEGLFNHLDFQPYELIGTVTIFIIIEWLGREQDFPIQKLEKILPRRWIRFAFYYVVMLGIYHYTKSATEFIYFQF